MSHVAFAIAEIDNEFKSAKMTYYIFGCCLLGITAN
jgi:hypothetical protein